VPIHPLDGARERLKRADENIRNLNREITDFLSPAPKVTLAVDYDAGEPIITDKDREAFEELKEFISSTAIPPRLKVLTGEIVHHLRCAFDHLAWQLSSAEFQTKFPTRIQFPIFMEEPEPCGVTKNKMSGYCRQIQGIASPTALTRIHTLQPYLRQNPSRDPLWLIHDMDRVDKHRELILVAFSGQLNVMANAVLPGIGLMVPWEVRPRVIQIVGQGKVDMKAEMTAQIALGELSERKDQPIIPTLQNFLRFTSNSIETFANEFA
jgi:hypothetical protein